MIQPVETTLTSFQLFISSRLWRFAKTMPQNPHEYTVRKGIDDASFVEAVMFIRLHGYLVPFGGRDYTGLDVEGWYYWTMGNSLDVTKIINRKRLC